MSNISKLKFAAALLAVTAMAGTAFADTVAKAPTETAAEAAYPAATPTKPIHGPLKSFKWEPLPNYGGSAALIHRSPDGKRVAVANKEDGVFDYTYEFDEFLFVTSGKAKLAISGGETFTLKKGDVAYIAKGTKVHFEVYKGFSDVVMLMSDDAPVNWK